MRKIEKLKVSAEISNNNNSYAFLYKELEEINRKIGLLNPKDPSLMNSNENHDSKLKSKLQNSIDLLQQTSKFSLSLFQTKLREKHQDIEVSRISYENQVMRLEDLLLQERNKFIAESEILRSCSERGENEKLRKEIKTKTDLLKLNEEKIKSLNEIRSSLNKETQELKEKVQNYEKKTKLEHTEVLSKIHDIHKQETEKLKSRIKNLENDFFNKSSELEKANKQITELLREIRLKTEELERKSNEIQGLSANIQKLKNQFCSPQSKRFPAHSTRAER